MHRYRADTLRRELVVLVLHQGDERTYDDRQPREYNAGQLIDERFAASGRHDDECVLSGKYGIDRLPLAGTEVTMTKSFMKQLSSRFLRDLFRHHSATGTIYSLPSSVRRG